MFTRGDAYFLINVTLCAPPDKASAEVYNEIKVAVREAGACSARVLLGDREYEVRTQHLQQ